MNLVKLIGRHADQRLLDALDRRLARRFDAQPATPTGFGDLPDFKVPYSDAWMERRDETGDREAHKRDAYDERMEGENK